MLDTEDRKTLKAADLNAMDDGDFAYIDSSGDRHLPIHDEAHVRAALARFTQTQFDTPTDKKSAAGKVLAAAKKFGIEVDPDSPVAQAARDADDPNAEDRADCSTCKGKGTIMDGHRDCPDCGGSGTRNDPTPEDAEVTALLKEAQDVLARLRAAQAKDPDADSDPDDKAVSNALDKAAGAIDAATVHQASDNAPEPRKQRHRSKVATDEYRRSVGREVRLYGIRGGLEIRSGIAGSNLVEITGQPIVYNQPYSVRDMLGEFQETMKPGVCANVLTTADTRFLFNHDGLPLARTVSGTLKLNDTPDALSFSAFLDTRQQLANDLVIAIERGDVSQMSVGFVVADDSWSDDWTQRSIHRFEELLDVSAVTYPASPTTSIDIANRMLMEIPVESRVRVRKLVGEIRSGKVLSNQNKEHLTNAANALASILDDHGLPPAAPLGGPDGTQNAPVAAPASAADGTGSRQLAHSARSASRLLIDMDMMEIGRRRPAA